MYLSLKTIFLLGAALAAAVPTTNDATLSQGIDASGSYISPDGLTQGPPSRNDAERIANKLADGTHFIVSKYGREGFFWGVHNKLPTKECLNPRALEARELTQGGPTIGDIKSMGRKLDNDTHIVITNLGGKSVQGKINVGHPTKECLNPPALEARELTQGGPTTRDIMRMSEKLDDHTHIVITNLGGGGVQWNVNVGHPTKECLGREPAPPDSTTSDATSDATLEARGLAQDGPSDEDVGKVSEKLDDGTHLVLFKGRSGEPVFRVNQGIPNSGCFMGKNPVHGTV